MANITRKSLDKRGYHDVKKKGFSIVSVLLEYNSGEYLYFKADDPTSFSALPPDYLRLISQHQKKRRSSSSAR